VASVAAAASASPDGSVICACIPSSSPSSFTFAQKACVRLNCVWYSCRNFNTSCTYGVGLPASSKSRSPRPAWLRNDVFVDQKLCGHGSLSVG